MNAFFFSEISSRQRVALCVGLAALAACALGAIFNARQFFISYLFAYLFWLGLSLGCLCVAMIHHLTGGRWGDVTRRFLEAGYMTLPMMAVLFLPILAGLHQLYPWARPADATHSGILPDKAHFQKIAGFVGRAVVYFVVWITMAVHLRKWSLQQDQTTDVTPTRQARTLSGPGVVIYALTVTFASIDWVMSLEPDWYSTIFPVIICGGQILAAFAFAVLMLNYFRKEAPFLGVVEAGHYHQLGNLLLTFVMFWTYVCFGQLLIIWGGNLPREISWYLHRIAGGWKWTAGFLALFNFFLPFFLLLFRLARVNLRVLRVLAEAVFLCQLVNVYWLVEPSFFPTGVHLHWMDLAAPLGLGGLWVAKFAFSFKRAAILSQSDPRNSYAFAHA
jgi:hypothetical protein